MLSEAACYVLCSLPALQKRELIGIDQELDGPSLAGNSADETFLFQL